MQFRPSGLWRHADFLKLWAGQAISQVGSQVTLLALPLTAIVVLGASPFQVGLLTALGTLPTLLFGLGVGVWVDRLRRRPLLIAADAGRAALLLGIPIAALLGRLSVEYLYGVAFLVGALGLVFNVASASYLPGLVGSENLVEAGGKLGLSSAVAQIAGPGLAGVLVELVGAPVAIAADAFSFLVSALSVTAIRAPEAAPAGDAEVPSFRSDLLTGLRAVWRNTILRSLIAATAWLSFWNSVLEAVWLLYVTRDLGLAATGIGTIFAIENVGLLIGSATVVRVTARLGAGIALVIGVVVLALTDLATPLVGLTSLAREAPSAAVVVLLLAGVGFGWGVVVFQTTSNALRQASTPDQLRGRMSATTLVLLNGLTPLGALLGGTLGQLLGLPETLLLTVVGELLTATWLLASPIRRLREVPGEGG